MNPNLRNDEGLYSKNLMNKKYPWGLSLWLFKQINFLMKLLKGFVSTRFSLYFVLGFSAFILFAHLGLPPLWGSEGRWAVIARSMLRSGDLLLPALGIHYYWDKPLFRQTLSVFLR
jgi:hypothetical protein